MIFLKSYFANTTQDIDIIPIIHDVRFAVRDSQAVHGLVTVTLPGNGASLVISQLSKEECLELKEGWSNKDIFRPITLSIPLRNKELLLDPKQMIYLVDFSDTGKRREFYVQVFGDNPPPQQPPQGGRKRT